MPRLGVIADDITGGSDIAGVLTREGFRTVQTIGVARDVDLPETDAIVVSLKSRTAPVDDAVQASREALHRLRELGVAQVFFKYCSTFDSTPAGNIGPVADMLLDELGGSVTVVCPAYPANGRTVYRGHLFVGDKLLSESSMARHPLTPMTDSNLLRVLAQQTSRPVSLIPLEVVRLGAEAIAARLEELEGYVVVDAIDDDDLRTIGAACRGLELVTGGAGLALGLGGLGAAAPSAAPEGPAIVLAGSSSEATNEQVRRWVARFPAVKITALDEAPVELDGWPLLVYATAEPSEVARVQAQLGAARAAAIVEERLADVARRAVDAGARRVVVAGGETSAAVLHALGVRALAAGPEIAPGVPWMRVLDGPPLALALKSGNFGGPDFLLEAVA